MSGNPAEESPIVMLIGTRPEAIKMAPLAVELRAALGGQLFKLVTSSQHGEISSEVLTQFGIEPDFELGVRQEAQLLSGLLSRVIESSGQLFRELTPSLVLVHGDTTTALGGALAAFYEGVPVGHVEAGLRTHDLGSPFPEELNRQVISRIAEIHFAPTQAACNFLLAEGVGSSSVVVTGNTVIDALRITVDYLNSDSSMVSQKGLQESLGFDFTVEKFVLVTIHRRENLDHGMAEVFKSIRLLSAANPSLFFVLPLHPNPVIGDLANKLLSGVSNVTVLGPLRYLNFVYLLNHCLFVMTDSGGIQEEAPFLGKPVLVMRETTERLEGVAAGTAVLVGTDSGKITRAVQLLIESKSHYQAMATASNPYGDGYACERILSRVLQYAGGEVL